MKKNLRYSFPAMCNKLKDKQYVLVYCPGWCESSYEIAQWDNSIGKFTSQINGVTTVTDFVQWFKKLD